MKTFLKLREEMVNYNHTNQHWQIRHNAVGHTFKKEQSHVILKDAKPHVDHEARDEGKKVHTYMNGTPVASIPKGHTKREIKFNAGNTEHPFIHKDDNSPVTRANYVEFKGRQVYAHYK
jgi:hypothetical protein